MGWLGYPDAMGIAAQVFDHLLGAAEGRFGIDHEGLFGGLAKRSTQGRFVTLEFTFADGCFQVTKELAAKHGGQSPDRHEVGWISRYPAQCRPARCRHRE